jgi:predicted ATPase
VSELAEALMTLARDHGFTQWVSQSMFLRGWVLVEQGQGEEEGMALLRQGMTTVLATGAGVFQSYVLCLLAETCGKIGQIDEGLALVAEALATMQASGRSDLLAEAYRLNGGLFLKQAVPDEAQAVACFHQALDVSRQQQAKSLELRAAMGLARLWQSRDKRQDAYELLAPVYEWFTEGFDTADLKEARVLLDKLEK